MATVRMENMIKILNDRFRYTSDKDQYGVNEYWTAMDLATVMKGDCEDYSLTLLLMLAKDSAWKALVMLVKGEAALHFVQLPQRDGSKVGHCVLEYEGEFTDNNYRKWTTKTVMKTKGYDFDYKYNVPLIAAKYIGSRVLRFFKKLF